MPWTMKHAVRCTIPGPRRLGLLDTLRFLRDPRPILKRTVGTYGDPFAMPFSGAPTVLTGHPEAIKAIYTADPDVLAVPMVSMLGPFFGPTSVMMTSGARHRRDRKLLAPAFHGARMRDYSRIVVDSVRGAAARWVPGRPFVMLETAQTITLDVILEAIFGVEGGERRRHFRATFLELMAAMTSSIVFFEFMRRRLGGLGPWSRFVRKKARFDALVAEELAARRGSAVTATRGDILSLLMCARHDDGSAMNDDELRDQLQLLLFGGHDTTSITLAWAFYWLHHRPELRARVLAEIDGLGADPEPDALAALPYLDAVCQETLRIHPVALSTARLVQQPLELMGHTVPPGSTVLASIVLLHDREDLYPEPRRFDPERFLRRRFSAFEFIPFGGGPRRCLGAAMALYETKLVLATVLRSYRLRLVRDGPVRSVLHGLTMGPEGGVPMIYEGPR